MLFPPSARIWLRVSMDTWTEYQDLTMDRDVPSAVAPVTVTPFGELGFLARPEVTIGLEAVSHGLLYARPPFATQMPRTTSRNCGF